MGDSDSVDLVRLEQAELIDRLDPPQGTPFGLHVIPGGHPAAELGRYLEREVFFEAFGNTPQLLNAEYRRFDPASVFLVVVDQRRRVPAGAVRIIVPSSLGLKSLEDLGRNWKKDPGDLTNRVAGVDPATDKLWDIATLAVGREYRRAAAEGVVSMALWQAIGVLSCRCNVDLFVAIIDVHVLRLVESHFHGVLVPFPDVDPKRYLDSPASVPAWCTPPAYSARLREIDPDLHAFLIEGKGLEPVVGNPDWDEAASLIDEVTDRGAADPAMHPVSSS